MSALGNAVSRGPADDLAESLRDMIRHGDSMMARGQQVALGPSEVGHPCPRKLAYGMMSEPGDGGWNDPLAALIGTAFHGWLDNAAQQHNEKLGYEKWLSERKVEVRPGLSGTCDLFDTDSGTVIDHKVPGTTRFKKYTTAGPSSTYRAQAHLYGRGYVNLGYDVKNVAIHWIPRASAQLSGTRVWMEPYDDALVDEILARIDNVTLLIEALQVESNPQNYKMIPIAPDDCRVCKWFNPAAEQDNPFACPGDAGTFEQPPAGLFDTN